MFSKKPEPKPKPTKPLENNLKKPVEPNSSAKTSNETLNAPIPKPKPPASILSNDLEIKGNIKTTGDIQISGTLQGDIRAHLLTVSDSAVIKGEVIADDIVIHGRIIGCVRGLKVRLTTTARVEGDIIHKTIAIENGAHFEGTVSRQNDPLNGDVPKKPAVNPEK